MNPSTFAQKKPVPFERPTRSGGRDKQGRDMHARFLRFLFKELQSCQTDAEKEALLPALQEARMHLRRRVKNQGMPTE